MAKDAPGSTQPAGGAWKIRVYYEDTDAGGVVFFANYLKFFERARTEWLRARGVWSRELAQEGGVLFAIKSTSIEYHAPARLDDELELTLALGKIGRASVHFSQHAWRDGRKLCSADVVAACVDATTFRPRPIPPETLAKLGRTD